MDALKLHELIKQGETSSLQLKESVNDAYKVGCLYCLYADREAVEGSSIEDISETTLKHFLLPSTYCLIRV